MRKLLISLLASLGLLIALNSSSYTQGSPRGKLKLTEQGFNPSSASFEAQGEPQGERRPPPDRGPRPGPDFRFQSFEVFSDGKVVKGAPYSAMAVTETVQTLSDGTRILNQRSETIYRDSEGRTRREFKLDRVGPFSVSGEPSQMVFIDDVVAGSRFALDPNRRTARKQPRIGGPPPRTSNSPMSPGGAERKTESLGKQTIEGVEAEGSRTTITIPAGRIGNDRPIEIVSERWESTELKTVVLSKHKDPRMGETTYRLTNIDRSEPAHSLFEIPSDYTVEENQPRMRPGRRPQEN